MRGLALAVAVLAGVALLTYWAGEQTEVVVLRTRDAAGQPHETKMWVVDHQGDPWVRVAKPSRRWYRRLLDDREVELVRGGATRPFRAEPHEEPEVVARLDAAFRARYGIVDWWYGLLLRRHAIPVRLAPVRMP